MNEPRLVDSTVFEKPYSERQLLVVLNDDDAELYKTFIGGFSDQISEDIDERAL